MIFSRRSRSGRHAKPEDSRGTTMTAAEKRRAQRAALLEELELEGINGTPWSPSATAPKAAPVFTPAGPFDSEADFVPPQARIDLGSLLVPNPDGVEVRLQTGDNGVVQQVLIVEGSSALQLAVLAGPRTDGLWDEVRTDIRKSLFDDGVGAEEVPGPWGTELRARLRTQEGFVDLRFVGVDGPRWMIQGVYQGPAATASPLEPGLLQDCLAGLVVRRGNDARPAREPLPMLLPQELAAEQPVPVPEFDPIVPGPVPPAPEPTRYTQSYAPSPSPADAAVSEMPRRKPSPRPRRNVA